jgi:hypothetical protein
MIRRGGQWLTQAEELESKRSVAERFYEFAADFGFFPLLKAKITNRLASAAAGRLKMVAEKENRGRAAIMTDPPGLLYLVFCYLVRRILLLFVNNNLCSVHY